MITDNLLKMHLDFLQNGAAGADWIPYDEETSLGMGTLDRVHYVEALTDCWSLIIACKEPGQLEALGALRDVILAAQQSGPAYPIVVLESDLSELVGSSCPSSGLQLIEEALNNSSRDVAQDLRSLKDRVIERSASLSNSGEHDT